MTRSLWSAEAEKLTAQLVPFGVSPHAITTWTAVSAKEMGAIQVTTGISVFTQI